MKPGEVCQSAALLSPKSNNVSLIPGGHGVERKKQLLRVVFQSPPFTHTHTHKRAKMKMYYIILICIYALIYYHI